MMDQAQSLRELVERKNDTGVQVITVTSAKGGVGKSSIALNLAIALNRRGRRALIVDMDLGLANIDIMLGVKTRHDLTSVINGKMELMDIIETGTENVKFISGGSGVDTLLNLSSEQIQRIISGLLCLKGVADTIIFDTGAGINQNIIRMVCASNATWLVTTPEPTSIMDAYALIKTVNKEQKQPQIQLIVNKATNEKEAYAALNGFIQIAGKYTDMDVKALGYMLMDENMMRAVKKQEPALISFPKSKASVNIQALADRFIQYMPENKNGISSFLESLFSRKIKQG